MHIFAWINVDISMEIRFYPDLKMCKKHSKTNEIRNEYLLFQQFFFEAEKLSKQDAKCWNSVWI